ncbi:uncharacterized protein LOC127872897 [Dreissena polymorpha]|uniref:uncharacterized protein LOC127872897 n=1 Tax=Dreissena polymorpha TaxID=45954 RepID=UPI002264B485|nr:uncharacterized protein LOC127872897 [Dreissena polymorpha]
MWPKFKMKILVLSIVFLSLPSVHGRFLGGTISWMILRESNIQMIYRLSWENGTGPCGPSCSVDNVSKHVDTLSSQLSTLIWTFNNLSEPVYLGNVSYVLTSFSKSVLFGWEHGEGAITKRIVTLPDSPFFVKLSDLPWISSHVTPASESGMITSLVDIRIRNDLNKINQSPYVSVPPYFGIAHNCTSVVEIPAEDPDGDRVRCRWAEPSECGGGCTNLPINSVRLDPDACTINIVTNDFEMNGVYRVTVMIYDYVLYNIKMGQETISSGQPLSLTPVLLTLRIINSACDAIGQLQFLSPSPKHNSVYSYSTAQYQHKVPVEVSFYIQDILGRKPDFMLSGPENITYTYENDDTKRTNVTKFRIVWHVDATKQQGSRQLCVWGLDLQGLTTAPRCLTDIIFDEDGCKNKTCLNNGNCLNVFGSNETCRCTPKYRSADCSKEIVCDDAPCFNKSTCVLTSDGFKCICPAGYTGVHCEKPITMCMSSPCANGSTCLDFPGHFQCIKPLRMGGSKCDDIETGAEATNTTRTPMRTLTTTTAAPPRSTFDLSSATVDNSFAQQHTTFGTLSTATPWTLMGIGQSIVNGTTTVPSNPNISESADLELWIVLAISGGVLFFIVVMIISVIGVKRYLDGINAPRNRSAQQKNRRDSRVNPTNGSSRIILRSLSLQEYIPE